MAGTYEGGRKATLTVKKKYGEDYHKMIGRLGGLKSTGGGFALNKELARSAGSKGGKMSKRKKEEIKVEVKSEEARSYLGNKLFKFAAWVSPDRKKK